jgi:replication factor A1
MLLLINACPIKKKFSLWDDQIKLVKEGDNVTIDKGYTREYRGEIILCVPRSARLAKH